MKNLFGLLLALASLLTIGCSSVPKVKVGKTTLAPTPLAISVGPSGYAASLKQMKITPTVPVFIMSTRNLEESPRGGIDPFGTGRLIQANPHFAIAEVSIGANVSEETLMSETLTDVNRKRTKIAVKNVKVLPGISQTQVSWRHFSTSNQNHSWFTAIKKQLDKGASREIVIFVHGYNTLLTSNTELLGELYHYRARDGAVINFEWPSGGRVIDYFKDKGNASHSTLYFRTLLSSIARQTQAKSIRIIGHSAGCPIVVNALRELRLWDKDLTPSQLQNKYHIRQVVLAAPDMDLMEFNNAVFDRFYEMSDHTAVYFSPNDGALALSQFVFGNRRLGRALGTLREFERESFLASKRLDLINVSYSGSNSGDLFGHMYFQNDPWITSDIGLSMFRFKPEDRGLVRSTDGLFWEFPNDYPKRLKDIVLP
ncbi:MAG: alpha/beta hydrolase [Verrucomicrobiota bacterium]